LAACGSDDSSSDKGGGGGETAVSPANVEYAKQQVQEAAKVPSFQAPGPQIDVSKLKGKVVYSIPISTSNQFLRAIEEANKKIADQVGVTYRTYPAQGKVSDYQQGFADAMNAKAEVILLNGPLPGTLVPQIAKARKAGIKIITVHEEDASAPKPENVDAVSAARFNDGARLMVDQAIADQNGKPVHALVIQAAETQPAKGMVAAIQDELKTRCGDACTATVVNVPVADWASKVQPQVQSELNRNPDINAVLPIYDPMVQYVVPAIRQVARNREIGIYSFNGTPSIMRLLTEEGGYLKMDVAEDPRWLAYVTMDQTFRVLLGEQPLDNPVGPLRVITRDNVAETGTPPQLGKGFGDEYVEGYERLWGLK
jgi:ribose transport system substrate-binding protein